ncbi:MAG: hypothetical protein M1816_002444 [Peltula sp. TS41687]|nr:MAG: hypothetical protein M1816_002444 [Peltula sp. TS41687]
MTAHAPLPLQRRPFASLDDSRLQSLQNTKNRQNALPTTPSQSMKRKQAPSDDWLDDAENIDPSLTMSKRSKNINNFDLKSSSWNVTPTKERRFILTDAPPSPNDLTSPIKPSSAPSLKRTIAKATSPMKRLGTHGTTSPIGRSTSNIAKSVSLPASAPTAGRSPKNKRIGILSRRRTASPFARIDPPRSKGCDPSPLSIDAALSGTISNYNPRSRVADPAPTSLDGSSTQAGWFFAIHEDTADETLTNLMSFSAGILDISDDEDRRREKDDRGKENIPPDAVEPTMNSTAARPAPEMDWSAPTSALKERREPHMKRTLNISDRAPLGDLRPSDFYDASAFTDAESNVEAANVSKRHTVVAASINAILEEESSEDLHQSQTEALKGEMLLEESLPSSGRFDGFGSDDTKEEIQIWESESAAGDVADEKERLQ